MIERVASLRAFAAAVLLSAAGTAFAADSPPVTGTPTAPGDFPLVQAGAAATVVYAAGDAKVVEIAAGLFADDTVRVSGVRPAVTTSVAAASGPVVVIGTIGQSPDLDGLISAGKVDVSQIQGGWERYHFEVVTDPFPGVPKALVIAGSDRRGTAFGVFSLSEAMGVSPWYWWADVPSKTMSEIFVAAEAFNSKEPSVKYRGIFINDEDWGLQEWSEKNFESGFGEAKDIGPKTYAKVFELLLRMKANYVWPAMHPSTRAFNFYPQDKVVADRYAIVMGSSHAEPMLRNNVDEWAGFVDTANGQSYSESQFNYQTNQGGVYRYWEQRAVTNGGYENVYTLGKRGIHDSGMVEGSNTTQKAAWLNTIFTDQRQILANHVNSDLTQVGQVFVPYKEVLDIYDTGLVNVPDDVTLVWPDDNHGYIRRLSSPAEQLRSGGGGVYYHISYWGAPADYLWLNSIPPALIWEELTKAYRYNCGRVWVINVGDIKPGEIGMEFAMRLAWDVDRFDENAQMQWLTEWAGREFGAENAAAIATLMDDYYRLGDARKPEHMNWVDSDPLTPSGPYPLFSHVHHGDEASTRLASYADLAQRGNAIHAALPVANRSAFFETVLYPILGADGMNRKFLAAGRAYVASIQGRNTVASRKAQSLAGYTDIQTHTATYNAIEGGKWNEMMDAKPRGLGVFNMPTLPADPALGTGSLGVAIEGRLEPLYLMTGGIVNPPVPGSIELNAVTGGTLSPGSQVSMQVATIAGRQAIWSSGSTGIAYAVGAGGRATYTFNVPTGGTYSLSCEVNCPTVNDDSWHIQMDGGSATVWNNLSNGGVWGWANFGSFTLTPGTHTLVVHQREDGAAMAAIKLTSGETVLVEDRSENSFRFPEFNSHTRRSFFIDLFNTGNGTQNWQITTAHPWVVVDQMAGSIAGEERHQVTIDWANAPRTGDIASSLTVVANGQSLVIPVHAWHPADPLPADVDFVEDNHAVVIEAEHFSKLTPGSNATWKKLPGLGRGDGSMMVSPPDAASHPTLPEILSASPMMEYKVFLRHVGSVTVTTTAIPTLEIQNGQGLRFAVAIDGGTPQIVDMARTSGSGSVWSRSVLRSAIQFPTTHALATAGEHSLKIWMVDAGVVLDHIVISTAPLPYSYDAPPETAAVSHGALVVGNGESYAAQPDPGPVYDRVENHGTIDVLDGSLHVTGDVTNHGTLRLFGDAGFDVGGVLTNHGVLDIMTWNGTLPPGFVNAGTVLDRSAVRIETALPNGNDFEITLLGYQGHGYQLQQAPAGDLAAEWGNLGSPQTGTGALILFSVPAAFVQPKRFFRVAVSP